MTGLQLLARFLEVRARTERLAAPLSAEDQNLQSMPDCSPVKWHRAHTTWFFETFLLQPRGLAPLHPEWAFLFNSYYEALGPRHARPRRGLLSRPGVDEISAWRREVDGRMSALLESLDPPALATLRPLVELGLAHEEQHQELLLTDLLHAFSCHPLLPVYQPARLAPPGDVWTPATSGGGALTWHPFDGGLVELGARPEDGFAFDNESPRHTVFLAPYRLAHRPVSVRELKAFLAEGGYQRPSLWLSEGLEWVRREQITAPLHGRLDGGAWVTFGLGGEREAHDDEPVVHLSFYEAEALATFLGARLPTEAEWEHAARGVPPEGHLLEQGPLHALPSPPGEAAQGGTPQQLFGTAWEWTRSSYEPYPGFHPAAGAVGEYNGKFMVNQRVLRGGSYFTPPGHVRASYRNFWHPHVRFQVATVRLAQDV